MKRIGVIGLGVVGRTVADAFEQSGVEVIGYDPNLAVGHPSQLDACSVVFVCVPTPAAPEGHHDVSEVWNAAKTIEPYLEPGTIIAIKSTTPPGTTDELQASFPHLEFASVPEFLVGVRAMETFVQPDRIVIGTRSGEAASALAELMSIVAPGSLVIVLQVTEAELAKLSSNAMLATKISLANELALVCESFGVAWARIQSIVGLDRRIGPDHLTVTPERGFGGMCLPKDLDGLIVSSKEAGYAPAILETIAEFNRRVRDAGPAEIDAVPESDIGSFSLHLVAADDELGEQPDRAGTSLPTLP